MNPLLAALAFIFAIPVWTLIIIAVIEAMRKFTELVRQYNDAE